MATTTAQLNRWDARSRRLRAPIEAILLPGSRWGSGRHGALNARTADVERMLAEGDYLHD